MYYDSRYGEEFYQKSDINLPVGTSWPGMPWGDMTPDPYLPYPQPNLADHHTLHQSDSTGPSATKDESEHFCGPDSVKGKFLLEH